DSVTFAVEEPTDAFEEFNVAGPVIAAASRPLHWLDLDKAGFPKAQHVLGNVEFLGGFAYGPEGVRGLIHGNLPKLRLRQILAYQSSLVPGSRPLITFFIT